MEVFAHAAAQMAILFLIMMAGGIARKVGLMNDRFDSMLSKLVMNIALPAMILGAVLNNDNLPDVQTIFTILWISVLVFAITTAIADGTSRLYRHCTRSEQGAHAFAMAFGNVGFIGFPVLSAIFGHQALLYGAIFNIPFNFFVFTYGAAAVKRKDRKDRRGLSGEERVEKDVIVADGEKTGIDEENALAANAAEPTATTNASESGATNAVEPAATEMPAVIGGGTGSIRGKVMRTLKSLCNPCMAACVAAPVLASLGITDNGGVVGSFCDTLGQLVVPASMLVIGSNIAKMKPSDMLRHPDAYVTSAMRLLVIPIALYLLFGLFVTDRMLLGVLVMASAMPVASLGAMFSLVYGGSVETMMRCTFITTVLSLITIPLVAMLVA